MLQKLVTPRFSELTAGFLLVCWIGGPACTNGPGDRPTQSSQDQAASRGIPGEAGLPPAEAGAADFLAAGLVGSKHDFTESLAHPRDLCTPCHTPHLSIGRAPLWDRRPTAAAALASYQSTGADFDGSSLLCLSCHDGVIATDVFTETHGTAWSTERAWPRGPGSRAGHPIGVEYPLADPTYHSIAAVTADGRIKLPEGRVQCISCHDPHNTHRHPGMVVRSNRGSRLCLACHRL